MALSTKNPTEFPSTIAESLLAIGIGILFLVFSPTADAQISNPADCPGFPNLDYPDAVSAKTALNECFPIESDAAHLVEYLEGNTSVRQQTKRRSLIDDGSTFALVYRPILKDNRSRVRTVSFKIFLSSRGIKFSRKRVSCFDFVNIMFDSTEEAQAELDACYPVGSSAKQLFDDIEEDWNVKDPSVGQGRDHLRDEEVNYVIIKISKRRIYEESQTWHVLFFVSDTDEIRRSQVMLWYESEIAFLRSGAPFRFENFATESRAFETILAALEDPSHPNDLDELLIDAGAVRQDIRRLGEITYVYDENKSKSLQARFSGDKQRWILEARQNDAGELALFDVLSTTAPWNADRIWGENQ